MKKTLISLLVAGALVLALSPNVEARGNPAASGSTLSVGATPVPHAELLNLISADLAAQGITLKVVEFTDYVQPNVALIAGDLDANFFQHIPYLETNEEWSAKLISAFGVHIEPFGLYSSKYKNTADLPNGASIAIPNDPSNGGRALLLLQANGLITLRAGVGLTATPRDVTGNPKNFRFQELEAAQLPRSLQDVDAAAINGNYALEAGFNPLKDSLIIEGADSPYVNIVVVQKGKEQDAKIQALQKALLSQKVKDYINGKWSDGSVVPVF
ncbi:MAG: MetQ/NlpA family ABC transporter substrate-binding protein [Treponema sp.]|jgi:D-methionine transport system substrate-binding protein|nr:MetQ/NlpA family ABC transporter substrate-binding protein [Treponema sp.]